MNATAMKARATTAQPPARKARECAASLPAPAMSELADLCNRGESVQRMAQLRDLMERGAVQRLRKENRTGMPDELKAGIEHLSGMPMDDVRVHYDSSAPAQLHAHALTQETDIHLAAGRSRDLAHEAWHVVQQKQGRVDPNMQMRGVAINDDPALEREADMMGKRAASTTPIEKGARP